MIIEQGKDGQAAEYVSKKLLEYNQSKIPSGLSREFEPINLFVKAPSYISFMSILNSSLPAATSRKPSTLDAVTGDTANDKTLT